MSKFKTTTIVLSLIVASSLAFADTPKVDNRGNSLLPGENSGVPTAGSNQPTNSGGGVNDFLNDKTGGLYDVANDITGGKIGDIVNSGTGVIDGAIGGVVDALPNSLGGLVAGLLGGGKEGLTLNTILKYLNSSYTFGFGNDYLKATCKIDPFDISTGGICDSANKIEDKIRGILNKKLNLGICTIGSDKASACGNKYLINFCQKIVSKAKSKEIPIGKGGGIGEILNDPLSVLLSGADKYVTVTRGIHGKRPAQCSIDDGSPSGSENGASGNSGKNKGVKNVYGEDTGVRQDTLAKIYSIFIERQGNTNTETAQYITKCMNLAPLDSYMIDGEINSENLLELYEACKPENAVRPSASEIHEKRQSLVNLFKEKSTSPDIEYGKRMETASSIQEYLNKQCNNKNSLAEAKKCEQDLKNAGAGIFGASNEELTVQIANIEHYGAMMMQANDILNVDFIKASNFLVVQF